MSQTVNNDNSDITDNLDKIVKTDNKATFKTYKRLLSYVADFKLYLLLAIMGNVLYSLMDLAFMYSLKPLTDEGLVAGNVEFMKLVPFYIMGLMAVRSVAGFISTYCMAWLGQQTVKTMRQQLIDSYVFLPACFFDSQSRGQLVSKVTYNTQQVANATTDAVTKVVREGGFIIFTIVMLFYTNWRLALVFFISAPLIGLAVNYASKRFKKISGNIQSAMGDVTQVTQEVVDGYKVIKTFGGEVFENDRFYQVSQRNFRQTMKMNLTKSLSTPLIQFIATLAIAAVIFFASFELSKQAMTPGDFIFMMGSMMAILKPLKTISNLNHVILQGIVAAQSIFEIIDSPKESNKGSLLLSEPPEQIEFDQVDFHYPGSEAPVLKSVSFAIEQGQTVALVGRSGSGKTTLSNLLLRFYSPTKGQVKFDQTDIGQFQLDSLRSQIGYVSQQVVLFNGTIAENIAYAANSINQEKLLLAAKQAHALEFIEKMPDGMNSLIGENGSRLSGGQRQRLAIARAIYKNSPIIILDEATSALDTESERHIQAALDALTENRTTIVIAHRLSTIEKADKIVVMDDGQVVEVGNHRELLARQGYYAKLHAMQFSESNTPAHEH